MPLPGAKSRRLPVRASRVRGEVRPDTGHSVNHFIPLPTYIRQRAMPLSSPKASIMHQSSSEPLDRMDPSGRATGLTINRLTTRKVAPRACPAYVNIIEFKPLQ